MSHLKNLINRTNVPEKPKGNPSTAEDFIEAVVTGHVIAAALRYFNMDSVKDIPSSGIFSQINQCESIDTRKSLFH